MKLRAKVFMGFVSSMGRDGGTRIKFLFPRRHRKAVMRFIKWLEAEQLKSGEQAELELTVDKAGSARNMDQNALMWSLYEIEADVDNGGMLGPGAVTKDDLYDRDMREYAEATTIEISADQLDHVKGLAKIKDIRLAGNGRLEVDVMITSSKWDVIRMAKHIDMLFNRLADKGVPMSEAEDVNHYWREWRQYLNSRKMVLHNEPMTEEEYRERQPNCEACGKYIGDGTGILAHISTRGSGITWGEEKKAPADWLHLCVGCELVQSDSIHHGGWSRFLEAAAHLRYKVMRALKRQDMEVRIDG